MKTWRPNQSGGFSNRVNVHDTNDNKLFVIEHYTDDKVERVHITELVTAAPELLRSLKRLIDAAKLHCHSKESQLFMRIKESEELIKNVQQ